MSKLEFIFKKPEPIAEQSCNIVDAIAKSTDDRMLEALELKQETNCDLKVIDLPHCVKKIKTRPAASFDFWAHKIEDKFPGIEFDYNREWNSISFCKSFWIIEISAKINNEFCICLHIEDVEEEQNRVMMKVEGVRISEVEKAVRFLLENKNKFRKGAKSGEAI